MAEDPQENNNEPCTHCDGTSKCPESRAIIEKLFEEQPDEFDSTEPLHSYMENCTVCNGEGWIEVEIDDDFFDEEFNDDVRNGFA